MPIAKNWGKKSNALRPRPRPRVCPRARVSVLDILLTSPKNAFNASAPRFFTLVFKLQPLMTPLATLIPALIARLPAVLALVSEWEQLPATTCPVYSLSLHPFETQIHCKRVDFHDPLVSNNSHGNRN